MAKHVSIIGYACEKCGKAYNNEYSADACCKEYECRVCGIKLDRYKTICSECHEKEQYDKAKKMTHAEYIEKYPGNMVVFNDEFYSVMEDVLDYCVSYGKPYPKYVWGTEKCRAEIDIDNIEEWALSDTFEDAAFDERGTAELQTFLDKWNKKYGLDYFYEDNIVVFVPEDMIREETKHECETSISS